MPPSKKYEKEKAFPEWHLTCLLIKKHQGKGYNFFKQVTLVMNDRLYYLV